MKLPAKIGVLAAGYVGALLCAAVVWMNSAATSAPDRQASSGMSAFGDSLLFVAVCAVAAVPPTGAALYCLRPYRSVWRVLAAAALAIATTGIAALVVHLAAQSPDPGTAVQSWSAFAILRILVAPLFALAFLLAGLVSPHRRARIALCAASLAEAVVFALVVVGWLAQIRG